ncbi:hypothetical protein QBC47DRAFT_416026 [Echria macrotheca]|uniref:Integral membrane protein n=1 Tax=Echria macrotheca TaxID=438768 RepID=A0AAJ0F3D9_9PEZI|nr:hypothetical protein QBC47DRAFT_416026 [Echria macrotheca]
MTSVQKGGYLIPPWYSGPKTSQEEIVLADIVLGFFLACASFTFAKAMSQTATRWHRIKKFTAYLIMVWIDWVATVLHSIIGWCVGHGTCSMQPSFWLFFSVVIVWTTEMHCLAQILVNRISLLLFDPIRTRRLKLGVFVIIFVLTSSVAIIWTPAEMEISERWQDINDVWDRGEKIVFLFFDVALNSYFVYLVRSSLIANGLIKYHPLFRFNITIITLSILLDIAVIGTTWLPDYWIYIQFRPLTHMVKLYIEMCNAELIGRVAQASVDIRNRGAIVSNPAVEAFSLTTRRALQRAMLHRGRSCCTCKACDKRDVTTPKGICNGCQSEEPDNEPDVVGRSSGRSPFIGQDENNRKLFKPFSVARRADPYDLDDLV